ncbi:hypothetical protein [Idiomarina xiamenensis]|uniref:hypothetical protein n=1 Tax=Idiomarina xiamenensis TaxID=1207041 RepID=UPI0012E9C8BB|nr:hypothetical protein [Idiomarina xiamenensis]
MKTAVQALNRLLSFSFAALVLAGCQPKSDMPDAVTKDAPDWVTDEAICQPQQLRHGCDIGGAWQLQLTPSYAPAERTLQLHLSYQGQETDADLAISRSYLTGMNMYMGKLPVVWRTEQQQGYQAELRLGLCAEPYMHWQLVIETITGQRITAEFVGYPPAFSALD